MHLKISPVSKLTAVFAAALILVPSETVSAADLYWDGVNSGTNAGGGSGTWDLVTSNWETAETGGSSVVWTNANNDTAIFGGGVGTVSLGAPDPAPEN